MGVFREDIVVFILDYMVAPWVNFMEPCWELVTKLMKLSRNKLEYYLQGMRAMEHILAAF